MSLIYRMFCKYFFLFFIEVYGVQEPCPELSWISQLHQLFKEFTLPLFKMDKKSTLFCKSFCCKFLCFIHNLDSKYPVGQYTSLNLSSPTKCAWTSWWVPGILPSKLSSLAWTWTPGTFMIIPNRGDTSVQVSG